MPTLYDGNGNLIEISDGSGGTGSSDFGVADYVVYADNDGNARQAKLTYQGKTLYPIKDKIKLKNTMVV